MYRSIAYRVAFNSAALESNWHPHAEHPQHVMKAAFQEAQAVTFPYTVRVDTRNSA
jgi:hypothetical protein